MPFNSSGVFQRVRNWVNDATAGVKIRADFHDSEDDGFAAGLTECITRSGLTIITQNIPWNSKRITGLADPVNPQDAATKAYSDLKMPLTGGTITGPLMVNGDIWANSGVIRFLGDVNKFLNHDGFGFTLFGGPLTVHSDGITSGQISLNATNYAVTDGNNYILRSPNNILFQSNAGIQWGFVTNDGFHTALNVNATGNINAGGSLTAGNAGITTTGGINASGNIAASGIVYGLGNIVTARATSGNYAMFRMENSGGAVLGQFYYDIAAHATVMQNNDTASTITLRPNGAVQLGAGWWGKHGFSGGYAGNVMNLEFEAGHGTHLWVDDSDFGVISTASDYRIKKDVQPLPEMWDTVKALKPIRYTIRDYGELFKNDSVERWGFVAHELQDTLIESAANGHKDEENVIQSPNWPTIVAALTKALQEAMTRIEALEAR